MQRKKVYCVSKGKMPRLKSNPINKGFNKFARTAKPFYVDKKSVMNVDCVLRYVLNQQLNSLIANQSGMKNVINVYVVLIIVLNM